MASLDEGIPMEAKAFYNFLEVLFTFINEQVEPKNLGVITIEKVKVATGQVGLYNEFSPSLTVSPEASEEEWRAMECQFYMVPTKLSGGGSDAYTDYGFEEVSVPGLTKSGWIKLQLLELILDQSTLNSAYNKHLHYQFLQNSIKTFPLYHTDPSTGTKTTFSPLPSLETVNSYATTLAKDVLGIADPTIAGIEARMIARHSQCKNNSKVDAETTALFNQLQNQLESQMAAMQIQQLMRQMQMSTNSSMSSMQFSQQMVNMANANLAGWRF